MDYERLYEYYRKLYEDCLETIRKLNIRVEKLEGQLKTRTATRKKRSKTAFTIEEYQKLKDSGMSPQAIADYFHVSLSSMYRHLRALSRPDPAAPVKRLSACPPISFTQYRELKDKGLPDYKIAQRLGVTPCRLSVFLRELEGRKVNSRSGNYSYELYKKLKLEGYPDYKIAEEMGISPSTLSNNLKVDHRNSY